jgi:hypothetical protein
MRPYKYWSAFQAFLWLAWGGLALILCWRGPWFTPSAVEETRIYWRLIILWVILTGGVLIHILFLAKIQPHLDEYDGGSDTFRLEYMNRKIITLGLIGGFSIAMPALAFTIIGFVAMVPNFSRSFSEQKDFVLPNRDKLQIPRAGKHSYIVAVDVSESNLPRSSDSKKSRLLNVCAAVDSLLAKDAGIRIVRPEDSFRALVFAGKRDDIISREDNYDPDSIRSTFCDTLKARLMMNVDRREHTNFEGFLDFLAGWAKGEAASHESVTIFIFSDFMHEDSAEATERIEKTVEKFMADMRILSKVQVVGFLMRDDDKWLMPADAIDILPSLKSYGMGKEAKARIWNEIPMSEFAPADQRLKRGMLILSSYREIRSPEPLDLRYELTPSWSPIPSSLKIPEDEDHNQLYFAIFSPPASAGSPLKVKFEDGKGSSPFSLVAGQGILSQLATYDRRGDSLNLLLSDEVGPSSDCELKVAVPSLGVIHSIRLNVFSTLGGLAEPALRLTLQFLSVVIALLALRASGIPEALGRRRLRNGKRPTHGV